jgi:hypothetical protein
LEISSRAGACVIAPSLVGVSDRNRSDSEKPLRIILVWEDPPVVDRNVGDWLICV